ncbi:helix-turn-helix transcriptional regulator [Rubrivivax rivuli]|uniref:Helix-turn-helix domain-containing protein n=1 Tax=Rubrivivax rivuli TaxID=1862385 RepID=A0A437RCH0_9BURK|nr:response regulator transcription factor [Rubrivivax rivuli]RVU44486.1 helix-turn-helix domain-containing protein [Rubrivivax rivuli]
MKTTRALAALRALCALQLRPEVLVPALLEALHTLVPSQRNLFDWTDAQGRLVRYFIEGPVDAEIARLYFTEFHNRREAEAMPRFDTLRSLPAGVRSAEELNHPGFFRSALYNEIWRPQGLHTRLEGVLRSRCGTLLGSLVLYRGPGERPFNPRDEQLLAAVLPAFAAALQAHGVAQADDRHVPSPDAPESLLLTLDGALCHASPGAERLLLLADGGLTPDRLAHPLPVVRVPLMAWLLARLRERAAAGAAEVLAPPPSLVHENGAGQFVASGTLLRARSPGEAPLAQVTLRRLEPHRVALERCLRGLPLTPGQLAVCRGLFEGQTHGQIGQQLGVATATIIDHVRKIHDALDLRSSDELRQLLSQRMAVA